MKSKNGLVAVAGLILFAGLIAAAIVLQSAYLLYAATGIPILLVPFLPDFKTSQTLKPGKDGSRIRVYRTGSTEGDGFVIIEAEPGAIPWNKSRLYFPVSGLPTASGFAYYPDTASVPVLAHDLVRHRRKKDVFGIELAHLANRFRTLSFTPDEVTRLIIRTEDLTQPTGPSASIPGATTTHPIGKELQA